MIKIIMNKKMIALALKYNLTVNYGGRSFECANCVQMVKGFCQGEGLKGYREVRLCMFKKFSGWFKYCAYSAIGMDKYMNEKIRSSLKISRKFTLEQPSFIEDEDIRIRVVI